MGLNFVKRNRRQRQSRSKNSTLRSTILTIASVDKEKPAILVEPPESAVEALGLPKKRLLPLEIQPVSRNQLNIHDLVGDMKLGNSDLESEVAPGHAIKADGLEYGDGKLVSRWVSIANRKDGATVVDGWLRTSMGRSADGDQTFWRTELLKADEAVQAGSVQEAQDAIAEVLARPGAGRAVAVLRYGDEHGETEHHYVSRRRVDDGFESPEAAAERYMAENEETVRGALSTDGGEAAATIEVVENRMFPIGGAAQKGLDRAYAQSAQDGGLIKGSRKYDLTEVHAEQRCRAEPAADSSKPASEKQIKLVADIARERRRNPHPAAETSAGAASAWIDENRVQFGWSRGQAVLREMTGDDGDYTIAVGLATQTASGRQIDAIATPACPNAPKHLAAQAKRQASARAALLAAPAAESLDAPETPPTSGRRADADAPPAMEM